MTLLVRFEKLSEAVHSIKVVLAVHVEQTQKLGDAYSVGDSQLALGKILAQEVFGALVVLVDHLEVVLLLNQISLLLELPDAQVFERLRRLACWSGVLLSADLVVELHHDVQHLLKVFHVVANAHLNHSFHEIVDGQAFFFDININAFV